MKLTNTFFTELQNRLKIGNKNAVHLNAIPGNSRYKLDLYRLSNIDTELPGKFIEDLLTKLPLRFNVSWNKKASIAVSLIGKKVGEIIRIGDSENYYEIMEILNK